MSSIGHDSNTEIQRSQRGGLKKSFSGVPYQKAGQKLKLSFQERTHGIDFHSLYYKSQEVRRHHGQQQDSWRIHYPDC